MTQDASAELGLFRELQLGVSGAKDFCILSPVSRGLNRLVDCRLSKFLRCLHRYQKGQMLVCYKVAVCIDSKRSGTAELILRLQEIEDEGFFVWCCEA